jgi:hypothetical protein
MRAKHPGQMKLGWLLRPPGNHPAAWLHPGAELHGANNFAHYVKVARKAEAANPDLSPAAGAFLDWCLRERLTIANGGRISGRSRTHQFFVGTPETPPDHMQMWFSEGGSCGFNLVPARFPGEQDLFVEQAVPVVKRPAFTGVTTRAERYAIISASWCWGPERGLTVRREPRYRPRADKRSWFPRKPPACPLAGYEE